jgi:hypothetical protein
VHVAVPVDAQGRLAGEIALATRGVIDEGADGELLVSAREQARAALEDLAASLAGAGAPLDDEQVSEAARLAVRRTLAKTLGFKPVTTASLVRVHR